MRIAFFAADFPYPTFSGASVRSYELIREFAKQHEVDFFCYEPPQGVQAADLDHMRRFARVHFIPRYGASRKKALWRKLWDYAVEPYHLKGFAPGWITTFTRLGENFDVVHCEELKMALYALEIKKISKSIVSLTHHNVESALYHSLFDSKQPKFERALNRAAYYRLRAVEKKVLRELDVSFSYSTEDHKLLKALEPKSNLVPTGCGCNIHEIKPKDGAKARELVFVGSLAYYPNHHGILWFLKNVFPLLPDFTLNVVGKSAQPELKEAIARSDGRARLTENPRSVLPYLHSAQIEIVPLFIGGGIRGKVLEGMAAGKAIVSTKLGVMGIAYLDHERNVLIADEPAEFANCIQDLSKNAEKLNALSRAARKTAEDFYSWEVIAGRLIESYKDLLGKKF
jgi:glycosyltransferase involved in cell wall biosynthesis